MVDDQKSTADELVRLARSLERLMARRRKVLVKVAELDHEIRTTRRMLNELTKPFTVESGELPAEPA